MVPVAARVRVGKARATTVHGRASPAQVVVVFQLVATQLVATQLVLVLVVKMVGRERKATRG